MKPEHEERINAALAIVALALLVLVLSFDL